MTRSSLLLRISLHRPVTLLMLLVSLVVVGVIAYTLVPLQMVPPGITFNNLTIRIPLPDSTPVEVMEDVAEPIEEQIRTIPGIQRIVSSSWSDFCWVRVNYGSDQDGASIYADVRDRMERILPTLPEGADRYRIFRFNLETDLPVLQAAITYPDSVENPDVLLENVIARKIEGVNGVARAELRGILARELEIQLDPERVEAYGIDVRRLIDRLRGDNLVAPTGILREGGSRYLIRVVSQFASPDDIRAFPIRDSLTLGQIATVDYRRGLQNFLVRVDGDLCKVLRVSKESEANTVATCEEVKRVLEEELPRDPRLAGFRLIPFMSQGDVIQDALENMQTTCLWGGLFAVVVLYLFLRTVRMTLVVAAAIPLSLLIAVVVIFFRDATFNVLSLTGLTLGIGMLIDNAIVIAENIFRHRQQGLEPRPAASRGVTEVALAVTLATLTTVAVFLPLIFLSGSSQIRVMAGEVGLPVCYSLVASLFVALAFIPLATTYVAGRAARRREGRAAASGVTRFYRRSLERALQHRLPLFLFGFAVLVSAAVPFEAMQDRATGEKKRNAIEVGVRCPPQNTLQETDEIMSQARDSIVPLTEELGLEHIVTFFDSDGGDILFLLESGRAMRESEFIARLKERLPVLPGVEYRFSNSEEDGEDAVEQRTFIRAYGRDPQVLTDLLGQVSARLDGLPGILEARPGRDNTRDEILVNVSREQAQRYQVNPANVASLVSWALRGAPLRDFETDEEELPFWIRYEGGDMENVGDLYRVPVYSDAGAPVPLANLASFSVDRGLPRVVRIDGRVSNWMRLVTTKDVDLPALRWYTKKVFDSLDVPEGYELVLEGPSRGLSDDMLDTIKALILGVVLIFLLMGVLFESFVLPLSVMFCVPFQFVGGFWALWLFGESTRDPAALVGFVILLGIVVNNAIVLIDCVNRFRDSGLARSEAIGAAAEARLRPIVMTACTTMCGLLPLIAIPHTGEGINYRPLAVVVFGGLLVSTIFTLYIVPLFYTLFDDLRHRIAAGTSRVGRGLSRRQRGAAERELASS